MYKCIVVAHCADGDIVIHPNEKNYFDTYEEAVTCLNDHKDIEGAEYSIEPYVETDYCNGFGTMECFASVMGVVIASLYQMYGETCVYFDSNLEAIVIEVGDLTAYINSSGFYCFECEAGDDFDIGNIVRLNESAAEIWDTYISTKSGGISGSGMKSKFMN